MYELYVKGSSGVWGLVDLGNDNPAINVQRNDIGDLKSRQTDYSQVLKLPKTPNNCKLFDFINESTVISDIRHKRLDARLYCNSFEILGFGGKLKFNSITNDFNCQLIGGLADFFAKLKELNQYGDQKTINDLNFTETVIRGLAGFQASQNFNHRDCFFAVADFASEPSWNNYSFNRNRVQQQAQYPFIWFKSIINKILEENDGYTLISDILENVDDVLFYNYLCIPFSSIKQGSSMSELGRINSKNASFELYEGGIYYETEVIYDAGAPVGTSLTGQTVPSFGVANTFEALVGGYYTIQTSLNGVAQVDSWYYYGLDITFQISAIKIKLDGSTENISTKYFTAKQVHGVAANYSGSISLINIELSQGEKIDYQLTIYSVTNDTGSSGWDRPEYNLRTFVNSSSTSTVTGYIFNPQDVAIGYNIPIKRNLPNITQEDFFRTFLQLFGLTVDIKESVITARTLNYVRDNKPNAINMSPKYQAGSGTQRFTLSDYAKNNVIKFSDESISISSDFYTEISESLAEYLFNKGVPVYYQDVNLNAILIQNQFPYGYTTYLIVSSSVDNLKYQDLAYINISDDNLAESKTLLEFPFEACQSMKFTSGVEHSYAKINRLTAGAFPDNPQPKLCVVVNTFQTSITDDNNVYLGTASLPCASSFATGKDARASYFTNKYYDTLKNNVLSDVLVIEDAEFNLSAEDIQNFDIFKPWYIEHFGAYFYVNKIKNFVSGKLTKCDLVRI